MGVMAFVSDEVNMKVGTAAQFESKLRRSVNRSLYQIAGGMRVDCLFCVVVCEHRVKPTPRQ